MDSSRRQFIASAGCIAAGAALAPYGAVAFPRPDKNAISLATWSIVRSFHAGVWKLTDVARIVREDFGLDGIEYVNQFFEVPTSNYLNQLNKAAADHGVRNVLIMVDLEGAMVALDPAERRQAVVNHRKWVDIAAYLGCHAIRCNAHGGKGDRLEDDPDSIQRAAESFTALMEYARPAKINVIIENHGGLSSDPRWLPRLCETINSPDFGILPDYGNYHKGDDVYEAVRLAMPYAKGVSVKTSWMPDGTHPGYDVEKLLSISKQSGFTGFWGIESGLNAGRQLTSPDEIKEADWKAVMFTKRAIQKIVFA